MSDCVKIALIATAMALIDLAIYLYFSPYQSCVRAMSVKTYPEAAIAQCSAQHSN